MCYYSKNHSNAEVAETLNGVNAVSLLVSVVEGFNCRNQEKGKHKIDYCPIAV